MGAKEERAIRVRGVDDFRDLGFEFFGVFDLLVKFLGLKVAVEGRDDVTVNLFMAC